MPNLITYLDTAIEVIAAGSLLSFLSNAVCIVNLLRKTSCFCQQNPLNIEMLMLS